MGNDQIPDPMAYPLELRRLSEDEGGGWLITFPDLPGCMSDGETIEEAIESGKDAFQSWMAVSLEYGHRIPKPADPEAFLVHLHLPQDLYEALNVRARAEGRNRDALALELIAQGLERAKRKP